MKEVISEQNLKYSLFQSLKKSCGDISADILEVGIDELTGSVIKSELIESLPLIKIIISLYRTGVGIREALFVKKVISFIGEFNEIDQSKRIKFIDELLLDTKKTETFAETVISLVDKAETSNKTALYGKLFRLHLEFDESYEDILKVCYMVDRSIYSDLKYLQKFSDGSFENPLISEELHRAGFLSNGGIDGGTFDDDGTHSGGIIYLTNKYGKILKNALALCH